MTVKNLEYFHIHRISDEHSSLWAVGNRVNWVQKRYNLFYDAYNHRSIAYNDGTGELPIKDALARFFNNSLEYQNGEVFNIVKAAQAAVKHQSMFIREQIFEEVRASYFPHLPSRKTCIWVCKKEALSFWWKTFNNTPKKKIFKLRLIGSIHTADQRHLLADTFSHNDLRSKAFEYWTGSDGVYLQDQEILFEGIIDILAEYSSPDKIQ